MTMLTDRLAAVSPSASMAVSQAAKAAARGRVLYGPALGDRALRLAVAEKFRRENGFAAAPDEICIANGARQIIFNALMATVNPGDEVICPAPFFVSYPEMTKLFGGVPVTVKCQAGNGFRLSPEALEAAITPRTRWLFRNNPGNPSGAVWSGADLRALGAALARHPQVMIPSDEICEHFVFDGRAFTSFAAACPGLRDRTLVVNGVSKAYAMTGWRVGYAAGPADLIRAMGVVQSQSCTSVAAPGQAAALIGGRRPGGAALRDDAAVAATPGSAYGLSPFFRISAATSEDALADACRRIAAAVATLPP